MYLSPGGGGLPVLPALNLQRTAQRRAAEKGVFRRRGGPSWGSTSGKEPGRGSGVGSHPRPAEPPPGAQQPRFWLGDDSSVLGASLAGASRRTVPPAGLQGFSWHTVCQTLSPGQRQKPYVLSGFLSTLLCSVL